METEHAFKNESFIDIRCIDNYQEFDDRYGFVLRFGADEGVCLQKIKYDSKLKQFMSIKTNNRFRESLPSKPVSLVRFFPRFYANGEGGWNSPNEFPEVSQRIIILDNEGEMTMGFFSNAEYYVYNDAICYLDFALRICNSTSNFVRKLTIDEIKSWRHEQFIDWAAICNR